MRTLDRLVAWRGHPEEICVDNGPEYLSQVFRDWCRDNAAPDNPTDIEDRRSTALIVLPPSAPHKASAGAQSKGAVAARETIERRGSGQRRYRNALIFVAANASNVEAARENARRERAWQFILDDRDLMKHNLTEAQAEDAKSQASRSLEALRQSVRGAWVLVLYPAPPDDGESDSQSESGYVMRSTRIVNRGGAKSIPQAVWDKVSADGTLIEDMGPSNLQQSLEPIWPEDRQHLAVSEIRDWFASYVYLPRLRDEATLDGAIQRLVSDLAAPYVFASGFDEEKNDYVDVIDQKIGVLHNMEDGLLVRGDAVRKESAEDGGTSETVPGDGLGGESEEIQEDPDPSKPKPKRFFASIPIESERAGLEVARIMDGLLVELTRTKGSTLRLTLEIEGTAAEQGYPEDVVETVKANARDLKLGKDSYGFEQD